MTSVQWAILAVFCGYFAFCALFIVGVQVLVRSGWLTRWSDQINSLLDRVAARIAPKDKT